MGAQLLLSLYYKGSLALVSLAPWAEEAEYKVTLPVLLASATIRS